MDLSSFMGGAAGGAVVNIVIKGVDDFSKTFTNAQTAMKGLKTVALAGAAALGTFFAIGIKQSMDYERVSTRLLVLLKGTNEERKAGADALQKQADALEALTGIQDDEIINAQATLAFNKLNVEQIKMITPSMLDLAAAMRRTSGENVDLSSTAQMLGKAISSGNAAYLVRYNIITETEAALIKNMTATERAEFLTAKFKDTLNGTAEALGNTFEGKLNKLKNTFANMAKEVVEKGGLVEALIELAETLKELAPLVLILTAIARAVSFIINTLTLIPRVIAAEHNTPGAGGQELGKWVTSIIGQKGTDYLTNSEAHKKKLPETETYHLNQESGQYEKVTAPSTTTGNYMPGADIGTDFVDAQTEATGNLIAKKEEIIAIDEAQLPVLQNVIDATAKDIMAKEALRKQFESGQITGAVYAQQQAILDNTLNIVKNTASAAIPQLNSFADAIARAAQIQAEKGVTVGTSGTAQYSGKEGWTKMEEGVEYTTGTGKKVKVETLSQSTKKYKDFIIRPGGDIAEFSENDTIIGVKNPSKFGGTNINVNIERLSGMDADEISMALQNKLRELVTI